MKRVLVFVADGTEEVEAITVVDYLRRADIKVDLVSVNDIEITGAHGIKIVADYTVDEVDSTGYDAVYSPGGLPGAYNIRDNDKAISIYQNLAASKKIVSALCAGPTILDEAGLLEDRDYTCFPGFEGNIKSGNYIADENVVVDGNVITGKGPAIAAEIAYVLIREILGEEKSREIVEDTLYNYI